MLKETIIKHHKGKQVVYTLVKTPKTKLAKYPPIYSYVARGKTKYKCFTVRAKGLNTTAIADTLSELLEKIDTIIFEHKTGIRQVVARGASPTVEEYFTKWIDEIYPYERTRRTLRNSFKRHVLTYIGTLKLKSLTHELLFYEFKKMVGNNKHLKSNYHIIAWTSSLNQMLSHALESKLIKENYMDHKAYKSFRNFDRFEVDNSKVNRYQPHEVDILLDSLAQLSQLNYNEQLMATYIMLLLFSGLRRSEGMGLRWKDINLSSDEIDINGQWKVREKKRSILKTEKSSYRKIPITDILKKQLVLWKDLQKKTIGNMTGDTYVFLDYCNTDYRYIQGNPRDPDNIILALKKFLKKIDLPYKGLHCFRHTCGSYLASIGVDDYIIQDILGHDNVEMTRRIYINPFNDSKKRAMKQYNNAISERNS